MEENKNIHFDINNTFISNENSNKSDYISIKEKYNKFDIVLPNATQGKDYIYFLNLDKSDFNSFNFFEFTGINELGLFFDKEKLSIYGIPIKSGDFTIKLCYKFTELEDSYPIIEKNLSIIINPDPRSLWKNIPSDKSDKYWKSDSDFYSFDTGRKKILIASKRGRSHAQEGKFRDDDFKMFHDENKKLTILALADGAGSSKYSRKGSFLACSQVIEYFKKITVDEYKILTSKIKDYHVFTHKSFKLEKLNIFNEESKYIHLEAKRADQDLKQTLYKHFANALYKAYKSIEMESNLNESKIKDYSTTILISIIKEYKNAYFISSFGIGDSPMGIYFDNLEPIIMHYPEEGDYSGQTYFLTMPEILKSSEEIYKRINYKVIKDFKGLFLMTDGVYDPKFETKSNLGKAEKWDFFWEDISTYLNSNNNDESDSKNLLSWLDFWSQGNHDDRTIAVMF